MINMNRPAIAGIKYMSAADVGIAVGATVDVGPLVTMKSVSALEE